MPRCESDGSVIERSPRSCRAAVPGALCAADASDTVPPVPCSPATRPPLVRFAALSHLAIGALFDEGKRRIAEVGQECPIEPSARPGENGEHRELGDLLGRA